MLLWGHRGQKLGVFLAFKVGQRAEALRFLYRASQPFPGNTFLSRLSQSAGHKKMVVASLFLDDSGGLLWEWNQEDKENASVTQKPPISRFQTSPRSCALGQKELPDSHSESETECGAEQCF